MIITGKIESLFFVLSLRESYKKWCLLMKRFRVQGIEKVCKEKKSRIEKTAKDSHVFHSCIVLPSIYIFFLFGYSLFYDLGEREFPFRIGPVESTTIFFTPSAFTYLKMYCEQFFRFSFSGLWVFSFELLCLLEKNSFLEKKNSLFDYHGISSGKRWNEMYKWSILWLSAWYSHFI